MRLWFDLMVEDVPIGRFAADLNGKAVPGRDSVYTVSVHVPDDTVSGQRLYRQTTIHHWYGDGAWVLVRKALVALSQVPDQAG